MTVVGFDVGAERKGFHGAALDDGQLVDYCQNVDLVEATAFAEQQQPQVVALDSPRRSADPGEKSRGNEREFAGHVGLSVFFTPDLATINSNDFYSWMRPGFRLYDLLEERLPGTELIEVFPTSLWAAISGPRAGRPRSAWSSQALARLPIEGLPGRLGQDLRDAIGAAYLAALYRDRRTVNFADLIAPDPDNLF